MQVLKLLQEKDGWQDRGSYEVSERRSKVYYGARILYREGCHKGGVSNTCPVGVLDTSKTACGRCKEGRAIIKHGDECEGEAVLPIPPFIQLVIKVMEDCHLVPRGAINQATVMLYEQGSVLTGHYDSKHWCDGEVGVWSLRLVSEGMMLFNTDGQGVAGHYRKEVPLPVWSLTKMSGPSFYHVRHAIAHHQNMSISIIFRRIHPSLMKRQDDE